MQIIILKDKQAQTQAAAALIAAQAMRKANSVFGFATGSTPIPTYKALIQMVKDGVLDLSAARAFNLDEYAGLPGDHPQSYRYFMDEHLFSKVSIADTQLPNGIAQDLDAECARYEQAIDLAGGIDLQLLGIGHNGHIGFNEPGGFFPDKTHCVALAPETIEANKRFFGSAEEVPGRALSMGVGTIMRARSILLVIHGAAKAEITKQALQGPVTPKVPASILQFHPQVTVLLDQEAASAL